MRETVSGLTAVSKVIIEAPVWKVWEALVTPPLIKQYLHGTEVETDWEPGSPIAFRGVWKGKSYEDKGRITRFKPDKLLQYSFWSSLAGKKDDPANYIMVTYKLEDIGAQTLLTVTAEDPHADEKTREHMEQNWSMVLNELRKVVEEKSE